MKWIRKQLLFLGAITAIIILHLFGLMVATTVEFSGDPVSMKEATLSLRNFDSFGPVDSKDLNSFRLQTILALLSPILLFIKNEKARLPFVSAMLLVPIAFGIPDGLPEKLFVLFTSPAWAPALTIMMTFGLFDGESWAEGMAAFAAQTWWMTLWWCILVRTVFRALDPLPNTVYPQR